MDVSRETFLILGKGLFPLFRTLMSRSGLVDDSPPKLRERRQEDFLVCREIRRAKTISPCEVRCVFQRAVAKGEKVPSVPSGGSVFLPIPATLGIEESDVSVPLWSTISSKRICAARSLPLACGAR